MASDFLTELADGYDTMCGERGAQLSGGQRQRIAIARALLAEGRVTALDEAVSNLDAESQQAPHEAFAIMRSSRTMLVVTHRLSTIRGADRVVMLDEARVIASGHTTGCSPSRRPTGSCSPPRLLTIMKRESLLSCHDRAAQRRPDH